MFLVFLKLLSQQTPLIDDWTTTNNSGVMTDDSAQSVRITSAIPENILSLRFDPQGSSVLFADYYMQFTVSVLSNSPYNAVNKGLDRSTNLLQPE